MSQPELGIGIAGEDLSPPNDPADELAIRLAEQHDARVIRTASASPVERLSAYSDVLRSAHAHFAQASTQEGELSPAGEWLLDNYYLVREASRMVREALPSGYYRRLPKLTAGPYAQLARVYALAREVMVFSDARVDIDVLRRFVHTYQRRRPLAIGEIWALPTMLRLVALEMLARSEQRAVTGEESGLPDTQPPLAMSREVSTETVIAYCITSLRVLSSHDWPDFFESVSLVEHELRQDPSGVYAAMDADTRSIYRTVVEDLAWELDHDEVRVAREAVALAEGGAQGEDGAGPARHVGYYLVGDGRPVLEGCLGYTLRGAKRVRRAVQERPAAHYLGAVGVITVLLVALVVAYAILVDGSLLQVVLAGLLSAMPASLVAVDLTNLAVTRVFPPRVLPKMDFRKGVAEGFRSVVVIPVLLTDADDVNSLLRQLELHYLTNSDPQLRFALLTDWADAAAETMPDDAALVELAAKGIGTLNERHGNEGEGPFHLLHRARVWNPSEGVWMGWERKRGKLTDLNRLILGRGKTSFTVQVGDTSALRGVRYVLTMDADTALPRDGARRLIATMAHPLNRPRFGARDTVASGYGILQPRVELKPVSANRSWFTRFSAGDVGVDLYTRAVSDAYHDLFGEGVYVGKGIYDVEAFERSLRHRVPENAVLSHDLFEGLHARAGLVTDVVLYEDYPPGYLAYARRMHRWVRGDWQLLPWLGSRVPAEDGGQMPSAFTTLDRWKIVDNLRRSLRAPALLLLFLSGWLLLPGAPLAWTLLGLLASATAPFAGVVTSLVGGLSGGIRGLSGSLLAGLRDNTTRWLLSLLLIPFEAAHMVDAIIRTLVRLLVTRRLMLEWTTAAHSARAFGSAHSAIGTWQQMAVAPALAVLGGLLVRLARPEVLVVAAPLLAVWFLSPHVVCWISMPLSPRRKPIARAEQVTLRRLARRTWLFFERFVGPDDHWLPPDHFQEDPRGLVAHRTSPTNIGLLMLSTVAAFDLGYAGPLEIALRLNSTFDGLDELTRYRGHLLNWYDTRSLEPLAPRYVSLVDSGNLAMALLVLSQALREMRSTPVFRWQRFEGLMDALGVLEDYIGDMEGETVADAARDLAQHVRHILGHIVSVRHAPERWSPLLNELSEEDWPELDRLLLALVGAGAGTIGSSTLRGLRIWSERIRSQFVTMTDEFDTFLPWLLTFERLPESLSGAPRGSAVGDAWAAVREMLPTTPLLPLDEVRARCRSALERVETLHEVLRGEQFPEAEEALAWSKDLSSSLELACEAVEELLHDLDDIDARTQAYYRAMDFGWLYDQHREVFYLGYNVSDERMDGSHYDLLASEARTASLLAIANGEVPQSHWLHLERPLGHVEGLRTLLSWNGSMFEYLMPALWLRNYDGLLMQQTCEASVRRQMSYARQKGVPWGISESGYYRFDADMNYQYRGFGVPGLGRKRGLDEDLVIAPYASLLALSVDPGAVVRNVRELTRLGMMGIFGLYEAIDYTRSRMPFGQDSAIVRSFYVHHHGMSLVALANSLCDDVIVERAHRHRLIQSVDLLLQEQIPYQAPLIELSEPMASGSTMPQERPELGPWHAPTDSPYPEAHYLSNGDYGVLITSAGGGHSTWRGNDLTRWRADSTLDAWGTWIYIQDRDDGQLWSAGVQPISGLADSSDARFSPSRADLRRQYRGIGVRTDVAVAMQDAAEVRLVTVSNRSDRPRRLRLVSYAEVALALHGGDDRHPAFSRLFIDAEYLDDLNALVFRRRPRSADDPPLHLAHLVVTEDDLPPTGAFETDRARFIGRGRTAHRPLAFDPEGPGLTNTSGATLDPIMALAQDVELDPDATVRLAFVVVAAESHQEVLNLARRYARFGSATRALEEAELQNERALHDSQLDRMALQRIQRLYSVLQYPYSALRADDEMLAANRKGQTGLWPFAISGDYPILLVRVNDQGELDLVRELLRAHEYWRHRGLRIDLVILNLQGEGYAQEFSDRLNRLVTRLHSSAWLNRRGGVFLLRAEQMTRSDQILLAAAARVVLDGSKGSLEKQLQPLAERPRREPQFVPLASVPEEETPIESVSRPKDLQFDNGYGGFSPDGREYVVYSQPGRWTPAPWINVVANEHLGFLVSEAGGGYTWSENSGENRLTPWRNDPVSDEPGEALYLRDEQTAEIWSPTPLPSGDGQPYLVRHGAGYTTFEHHSHGLRQRVRLFVAPDASVKIIQLRLENAWQRPRRVTATYYVEWVLGNSRDTHQQYIIPEFEPDPGVLLARNPYNEEFGARVAFLGASVGIHGLTCDRLEFLGHMGRRARPAALRRTGLYGAVRPGLDPCAALQVHLDLAPGETQEVHFVLGQGSDRSEAVELARRFRDPAEVDAAWEGTRVFWEELLGQVTVETPDPAANLLLNRWLLYQTLACRVWARSALYQSSGAYGYRDQLQDVLALLTVSPETGRAQIVRAASHQFEEGDVLHWWHPPSGRGVRTRISDDLLWLPYVAAQYVQVTGDRTILDEEAPFVVGDPLGRGEEERYAPYEKGAQRASIYAHCMRAIERGSTMGERGLPLIGGGDWNDGMNRVGIHGRGESVWLAWFLYAVLRRFGDLCEARGEVADAERLRSRATALLEAIRAEAWDGDWYLRGFYDDGAPLGSHISRECQIDSIAQSWAVLSGAALADEAIRSRAAQGMAAVGERLVRGDDRLILLFTPPFDRTSRDPGYVKGYPPGIRENGGQYTHAAIWAVWAFAELGDGDRAAELYALLNPIYHSDTRSKAQHYRVEPYVVAADVYGVSPHVGRGGWTWYTGSSSWMYRLGMEAILGLRREGDRLWVNPCVASDWRSFRIRYRVGHATYVIRVENPQGVHRGVRRITLDGRALGDGAIPIWDDGQTHDVLVEMGAD